MNYLAHALLAAPDRELMLGGLMGDFVKGRLQQDWPGRLGDGLRLHRRIDAFTDAHPLAARSRARFRPPERRFAGVIVDLCYDHFLARDFARWSGGDSLARFTGEVYALLLAQRAALPGRLARVAPRMAADDWLGGYAELQGVGAALAGISRRSPRAAPLAAALPAIERLYDGLEADFEAFFPALEAFVADQRG